MKHIVLDIDDTITYSPDFFVRLSKLFGDCRITVVTFRDELTSTRRHLDSLGLRYDELILSSDPIQGRQAVEGLVEWKARIVNQLAPDLFFEDMPEVIAKVTSSIHVFMPCDELIRNWLRDQTTK